MADDFITTTTAPWGPQQAPLQFGFGQARSLYDRGPPQYFPDSTVAQFGDDTNEALNAYMAQARSGSPLPGAAMQQNVDTLQGKYLGANPYLSDMFDEASRGVTRQYQEAIAPGIQAQFANSGRTGSGLYANALDSSRDTLGTALSGMGANMYGQSYENERARQMQAAQQSAGIQQQQYLDPSQMLNVGNLRDAKAQENITDQFNRYQYNTLSPWENLGRYNANISGGYGGETQQPLYDNSLMENIGLGLSGFGIAKGLFGF